MTANVSALSNCMNTSLQQIKTVLSSANSNHKNDKFSSVKAISTNLHSKVLNTQQNTRRSKSWGKKKIISMILYNLLNLYTQNHIKLK